MKIKKNARHEVEIIDVTAKGFGVGNIDGFTLFIDGGLPEDRILAQIVKVKARYGYGKIIEIQKPSPYRIESLCPVSARCGGCQWQHCDYKAQLGFKKRILTDALVRIGGIENPPVEDVTGMDTPLRYRNKAVFPVVPGAGGEGFQIGMYAPRSHRIVEVSDCIIQDDAHKEVLDILKKHMKRHKLTAYDETTHKGLVRFVIVRTSVDTDEVMVVLVINGKVLPGEVEFSKKLEEIGVTTMLINRHESRGNTVMGEHFRLVYGTGFIHERLGDINYRLSAPSFFQINTTQANKLYDIAVSLAALDGTENIIDAHTGVGGVALYAAKHVKNVHGIDVVQAAVSDAEENARLNGIVNARFTCGTAEAVLPDLLNHGGEKTHAVFLDPPRKGCEPELLKILAESRVEKIIYISCDPATLARDIKILCAEGYSLETARPVDMFPMTGKIETCCLLKHISVAP